MTGRVSLRLKRLEEDLGVKLFERRSNKLLLADQGRLFCGQIARCLGDLRSAVTDIRSDTLPCLDAHFAEFAKSNPDIKLTPFAPLVR